MADPCTEHPMGPSPWAGPMSPGPWSMHGHKPMGPGPPGSHGLFPMGYTSCGVPHGVYPMGYTVYPVGFDQTETVPYFTLFQPKGVTITHICGASHASYSAVTFSCAAPCMRYGSIRDRVASKDFAIITLIATAWLDAGLRGCAS